MGAGEENNAKIVNAFLRDVTATLRLRLNFRLILMVMMEVTILIATTKKRVPLCLCAAMKMELLLYMMYIDDYQIKKNSSKADVAEKMPDSTMIVSNDELSLIK